MIKRYCFARALKKKIHGARCQMYSMTNFVFPSEYRYAERRRLENYNREISFSLLQFVSQLVRSEDSASRNFFPDSRGIYAGLKFVLENILFSPACKMFALYRYFIQLRVYLQTRPQQIGKNKSEG